MWSINYILVSSIEVLFVILAFWNVPRYVQMDSLSFMM